MVKVMRSFTLDHEVVEMLSKADNASGLINKLVIEHYNGEESKDIDVLQSKLKGLEIEADANNKKIEHLRDKIIILQMKSKQAKDKEDENRLIRYRKHLVQKNLDPKLSRGEITQEEYFNAISKLRRELKEVPEDFDG